jgi:tRNA(Arg) A34 adenosine deaminase TadA
MSPREPACSCTRRSVLIAAVAAVLGPAARAKAAPPEHLDFIAAAFKMKDEAVAMGDQAYGAVVVKERRIIGYGPSRVVLRGDPTAHAEREAIREAQARLGSADLSGCVLYSTSRPCAACERAAGEARIARMIHGADANDAGPPR